MEGLGGFCVDGKEPTLRINRSQITRTRGGGGWEPAQWLEPLCFLIGDSDLSCLQVTETGSRSLAGGALLFSGTRKVGEGSQEEGGVGRREWGFPAGSELGVGDQM